MSACYPCSIWEALATGEGSTFYCASLFSVLRVLSREIQTYIFPQLTTKLTTQRVFVYHYHLAILLNAELVSSSILPIEMNYTQRLAI